MKILESFSQLTLRPCTHIPFLVFTFGRNKSTPGQVRLVRHQYYGFLCDILIGPEHLKHLLGNAKAAAVRRGIDDAVAMWIIVGQAFIRLWKQTT